MVERSSIRIQGLRALFLLGVLLLVSACSAPPAPPPQQLAGHTMGTTWSVKWYGKADRASLEADLNAMLQEMNQQMSTWKADSAISQYNRGAPGSWHVVPEDFWAVVDIAFHWADVSGGLYDPTVGPLVNLWGFGPQDTRSGTLPTPEQVAEARERVGFRQVQRDPQRRALLQPGGIYLDLSSVAKGYAVDKLAMVMEHHGLNRYLVEIGGELKARGLKPQGHHWRVGIEQPLDDARQASRALELRDMAIATSGDYRNVILDGDNRYSHTLNPLTGYPVPRDLASVTVLHESAAQADALATMLTVMGATQGVAFAEETGLPALFIERQPEGFRVRETAALRQFLLD